MKKLMLMAFAIAIAGVASAASVNWSSGVVYKPTDGTAKIGAQSGSYVFTVLFFTDADCKNAFAAGGTLSVDTTKAASKFTGEATGFAASTTYYTYATIVTDGYQLKSDIGSFTMPGTGDLDVIYSDGTGLSAALLDTTKATGGNSWTSTAAPEPTSGILLLLGMAGLALKRKQA